MEKKAEEDLKPSYEGLGDKIRAEMETNFSPFCSLTKMERISASTAIKLFMALKSFLKKKEVVGTEGRDPVR